MNKKVLIGVGVLAVAGVAFYLWNKNKSTQNNNIDWKKTDADIAKEFGLDLEQVVEMRKKTEGKSNATSGMGKYAIRRTSPVNVSYSSGADGESITDMDLVKTKEDYRVQKEAEGINYYPVNKGFYFGGDGSRTFRTKNIR